MYFGFEGAIRAVVIGARGGLGEALCARLQAAGADVWGTSRDRAWVSEDPDRRVYVDLCDEQSLEDLVDRVADPELRLVINATGLLHDGRVSPERTWRTLQVEQLNQVFAVQTVGVALLIKHLMPQLPRRGRAVFANISARVASIGDNRLGGWYSYRASKAAGNMLMKCAALEAKRSHRGLLCVALHPGTVDTDLSRPFSARVPPHKLFTAVQSAAYLDEVVSGLTAADSGTFWAWDGQPIPW